MQSKAGIAAALAVAAALLAGPAAAGPWLPQAGTGDAHVALRLYRSDRAFPASRFGPALPPGPASSDERQLKVTGLHGLGGHWAITYDLRAARVSKTKTKKGVSTTATATGLQDQVVGLARGLRQGTVFADAVALSVVVPTGSASSHPPLGVGHAALEPDYLFGWRHRFGRRSAYGSVSIGPRYFFDSGVTQWRTTLDAGIRLAGPVGLFGSLFQVRTFGLNGALAAGQDPHAAEQYNLLRGGIGLRYALTADIRPRIAYEFDLKGRASHAGHRLVLSLALRY